MEWKCSTLASGHHDVDTTFSILEVPPKYTKLYEQHNRSPVSALPAISLASPFLSP